MCSTKDADGCADHFKESGIEESGVRCGLPNLFGHFQDNHAVDCVGQGVRGAAMTSPKHTFNRLVIGIG